MLLLGWCAVFRVAVSRYESIGDGRSDRAYKVAIDLSGA